MQNASKLFVGIALLVIGYGVGYTVAAPQIGPSAIDREMPGTHAVSDDLMDDPTGMAGTMADMSAQLAGKTGDAFDQTFISEMIIHHQGAVEMAQLALTNAKHKEIKDLAQAIITAQNKEIDDMRLWQRNWYGR